MATWATTANSWSGNERARSPRAFTKSPFPATERYGLTSQIRGACVSILANLAEGCGRNRVGELSHFLSIALGSAAELECHAMLARDLGYLTGDQAGEVLSEVEEIRRMLAGFAHRLKHPTPKRARFKADS